MNNILDRIRAVITHTGLSDTQFAKKLNIPQGTFSNMFQRGSEPRSDMLIAITKEYGVNPNWLLTGEGRMFVDTINGIKVLSEPLQGAIPYYDVDVMAHIAEALDVRENPAAYVSAPGFEDCFACFPVYGNSMAPKISSGDIVCVSKILAVEHILWGEIYVIVTDVMRVVKTLHPGKSEECLVLRSINPDFAGDTILKKQDIKALYLVKGIISRIAM